MITIDGKRYVFPENGTVEEQRLEKDLRHAGLPPNLVPSALSSLREWSSLPERQSGHNTGVLKLNEVFCKQFTAPDEMVAAVVGHTFAAENRAQEERLAFQVLEHLGRYERFVLDDLVVHLMNKLPEDFSKDRSYYGEGAILPWSAGDNNAVFAALQELPPIERLYKKVAFLHDLGRVAGRETPGRDDHKSMRRGKWTLNETDPQVIRDRRNQVSIWSGTSGSAMDMTYLAWKSGVKDVRQLTALAWLISTFFHFMPIVQSPTHTFTEVMRGAEHILQRKGRSLLDFENGRLPDTDFASRHLNDDGTPPRHGCTIQ